MGMLTSMENFIEDHIYSMLCYITLHNVTGDDDMGYKIEIECVSNDAHVLDTIIKYYSYGLRIDLPKDTDHINVKLFEPVE